MSIDELVASAQARVGAVLARKYRLERVIGIGGMATVYEAVHLRNGNRVAIKVLHRELAIEAHIRARFLREGYASNAVGHAGTVRVLDDDVSEDGTVFLVMELLEGETLDERWERSGRRLAMTEVTHWTWQMLDVLAAAHAKGIVHRDLKPQNVFLTRDGVLKVLDFGMARVGERPLTMTRSGALIGTPPFMAPEQALGRQREIDALSDVWAVGATAFTLLSGRYVHTAETPEEALVRAATWAAPPLASVAPEVPAGFARVIDRALAFERSQRWPSARAMQEAILASGRDAMAATPSGLIVPAPTSVSRVPTLSLPSTREPTKAAANGPMDRPAARPRRTAIGVALGCAAAAVVAIVAVASGRPGRSFAPSSIGAPPPSSSEEAIGEPSAEIAPPAIMLAAAPSETSTSSTSTASSGAATSEAAPAKTTARASAATGAGVVRTTARAVTPRVISSQTSVARSGGPHDPLAP